MTTKPLTQWLAHRKRKEGTVVDTAVLHASAGSTLSGAIETLKERGLSYHYIIDKDGSVTKCCPSTDVAYHAGSSYGPHEQAEGIDLRQNSANEFIAGTCVNEYTIGICFINLNDGKDRYTGAQMESAEALLNSLKTVFPLKWITTHYWVSPKRKSDPRGFNIEELAKRVGLKVWKR